MEVSSLRASTESFSCHTMLDLLLFIIPRPMLLRLQTKQLTINNNHREWDRYTPQIACAMNTSVHTSTSFTPYYSDFGTHMRTAGNTADGNSKADRSPEHHQEIRERVLKHLKKSHLDSKRRCRRGCLEENLPIIRCE